MTKKAFMLIDKALDWIEILMSILLLVVILIKAVDMVFALSSLEIVILTMEFEKVLSLAFGLIIGVEFVKMLCHHSPKTVIDVLLFAMARYTVLYSKDWYSMLAGVACIAGLFAIKKYLVVSSSDKKQH